MKTIWIPNCNVGYFPSRITHIFLVCSTNIDRAVLVPRLKRQEHNNKKICSERELADWSRVRRSPIGRETAADRLGDLSQPFRHLATVPYTPPGPSVLPNNGRFASPHGSENIGPVKVTVRFRFMLFITADKEGLKHTLCTFTFIGLLRALFSLRSMLLEIVKFRVT